MNSPALRLETQEACAVQPGSSKQNANYVGIVNPITDPAVKRKLARKLVKAGRAEWTGKGETSIRLIDSHKDNVALRESVNLEARDKARYSQIGYDKIEGEFTEPAPASSGGYLVIMQKRVPARF